MMGWICYLTVALVWGSTYFAIALGLESFTPYGMITARFLVAGLLALGIAQASKEPPLRKADIPHLMLVGALMLSGSKRPRDLGRGAREQWCGGHRLCPGAGDARAHG